MYNVVIFDVDGTLIDGTEGIISSVKYMIEKHSLTPLSDKVLESFIGPPIQNPLKQIYGMTDEKAQQCTNTFRAKYCEENIYKARVYDGIYSLLETLRSQGYKMGVATYKRQDYAIDLMKHLGLDQYFTSICGADNENKLKKIDLLKNCMMEMRTDKEQTILVGDSIHDAGAASELGVEFIGVTYGFGFKTKEEIKEYNPLLSANKVSEITEYFNKYRRV